MNLPNAITAARIAAAPLIAILIVIPVWQLRLVAWLLYVTAAVTDYYDGKLARTRKDRLNRRMHGSIDRRTRGLLV